MQKRFLRTLILLSFLGSIAIGCESPTEMPVGSTDPAFGVVANSDIGTYYYPKRTGLTYVYSNKLITTSPSGSSTAYGSNDTVRTLGFQGFEGSDSVFAISIRYQVAQQFAGRGVTALRYLPTTASFGGAYSESTLPLQGELNTASLATRATSTDSITAPTYGRMRSLASDFAGGSAVWQTDTIYYSCTPESVALYGKSAQGAFLKTKDLFCAEHYVSNGESWSYSLWQTSTMHSVIDDNRNITVGSSSFNAIQTSVDNAALNVGSTSQKYFASGFGPIRQVETWWVTSDGVNRVNQQFVREGVVVLDWDEIITL